MTRRNTTASSSATPPSSEGGEAAAEGPTVKLGEGRFQEEFEETPLWISVMTMIGYGILFVFGHIRDFLRKMQWEKSLIPKEAENMKVGSALFAERFCRLEAAAPYCLTCGFGGMCEGAYGCMRACGPQWQ